MRLVALAGVIAELITASAIAALTTCRDCGRQVSDEALMCPGCGRSGDAIRRDMKPPAPSKPTSVAAIAPSGFIRSVVRVATERAQGLGVVVGCGTGVYAVTCQDLVGGVRSLNLSYLDGEAVPYSGLELASDRNLARVLLTSASNTIPFAMNVTATNPVWAVTEVPGSNAWALTRTADLGGRLVHGMPMLDASTNLAAVVVGVEPLESASVVTVSEWITVDTKAYRTQVEMLRAAFRGQKLRDGTVVDGSALRQVQWLTPFLKLRADAAILKLEKSGGQP